MCEDRSSPERLVQIGRRVSARESVSLAGRHALGHAAAMSVETLSELDDPRLDDYRSVKDADWVRTRGLFIAESPRVVERLLVESTFGVRSVLLSEARFLAMRTVIEPALERRSAPLYVLPQALLDKVVGFHLHRGCLAAGIVPSPRAAEAVLAEAAANQRPVLVLEEVSNTDNIGGLFRNAAALGAGAVLLDERSADPLYRKSIRVSIGATLTVPFARVEGPWPASLQSLLERQAYTLVALTPRAEAEPLESLGGGGLPLPPRVALMLGREGEGLGEDALRTARLKLRIPMGESVDSLNVATAAAVALYAIRAVRPP
jgi:tRNA G18 (ribose-2'-O)-methylase SpoU